MNDKAGPSSSSSSSNRLFDDRINKSFTALLAEDNEEFLKQPWHQYSIVEIENNEEDNTEMEHLVENILGEEHCFQSYMVGEINFEELLDKVQGTLENKEENDDDSSCSGASSIDDNAPAVKKSRLDVTANAYEEDGIIQFRKRRKKNDLTPALAKMIGTAEMALIEGKLDEAKEICNQVCEQAPLASEPYYVLSDIFYRKGNHRAQIQCLKISAALDPSDTVKWRQLLDIAESNNRIDEAIQYCKKVVAVEKQNLAMREKLVSLHEQANHVKPTMFARLAIFTHIKLSNEPTAVKDALNLAQQFCVMKDYGNAAKTYEAIFHHYTTLMSERDENDAVDLMLHNNEPQRAIKFLAQYCGIVFRSATSQYKGKEDLDKWNETIIKVSIPSNKAPDIVAKVIIALLQTNNILAAEEHVKSFISSSDVETCGDWLYDMAEAYARHQKHTEAIDILLPLTKSENYCKDMVLLLLAQCYSALDDYEQAVRCYERCIQLAPHNTTALLELVDLHRSHGYLLAGIDVLKKNLSVDLDIIDPQRLVHYCQSVEVTNDWEEYLKAARELLFGIWCRATMPEALWNELCHRPNIHLRYEAIQHCLRQDSTIVKQLEISFERKLEHAGLSLSVLWDIFLKMLSILYDKCNWQAIETAVAIAYNLNVYRSREEWSKRLNGMLVISCLNNRHFSAAYKLLATHCIENPKSNAAWNVFNIALTGRLRERYDKFVMRERKKNPDSLPLAILNAHNSLCSQSYRVAMGAYVLLSEKIRDEPLFSFCSGVCCLSIACQKLVECKHRAFAQGIGFMTKYAQLRGDLPEVKYNLGRFFQHASLNHAAIPYYEAVVDNKPKLFDSEADNQAIDLSKEAAFNLMLLYKKSDNRKMAALIMQKYLVIE